MWSLSLTAQDLTSCGTGYVMDLSVGYTPTSTGLTLCGCNPQTNNCELVHIIMRQTHAGGTTLLECPEISLTERWWREKKDLVDIYNPITCEEYEESPSHMDRYIFETSHLMGGDTLSILVCKTDDSDQNVIELSATPGTECSTLTCPPQMSCPVEVSLHPDAQCRYTIPDFTSSIILRDTCGPIPAIVTADYVLMQNPIVGTEITAPTFVEIEVATIEGEVITTCDVSILIAANAPPILDPADDIVDIYVGDPFPHIQDLYATDTVGLNIIQQIPAFASIDSFTIDDCDGYTVTYRWTATDGCNISSETSQSFRVLPDTIGPAFLQLPDQVDTIIAGDTLPDPEILIATNPDGTEEGITITSTIDPFEIDDCHGYEVTHRWRAVDSCGDDTEVMMTFYVEPNGQPPVFTTEPMEVPTIYASDDLPQVEDLIAVSTNGDDDGIMISHISEVLREDPCDTTEVQYIWTAVDTCGLSAEVSTSFLILPDTLTDFVTEGIEELMVELTVECTESALISVPIDLDRHEDKTITIIITDQDWMVIDEYIYTGPEDYEFGMGDFHVIYNVADQCGNSVSDTINIQAADVSAPLFVCTEDHFIIIPAFSSCSAVIGWDEPLVQDNCEDVVLRQVGGPSAGEDVSIGTYDIIYEAEDASGNVSICGFKVTVSSMDLTTSSCEPMQVAIDASCSAIFSLEALLGTDVLVCQPDFEVSIFSEQDTIKGDSVEIGNLIGEILVYQFCDPITGVCCSMRLTG